MEPEALSQREMLKEVMLHAYGTSGTYKGEGDHWGWLPDELDAALESKAYVRVLRSEEFCRVLFTPRIQFNTIIGDDIRQLSNLTTQRLPDNAGTVWKEHHAALQTEEDPILYCWQNMP
jgi:hypothetical protein